MTRSSLDVGPDNPQRVVPSRVDGWRAMIGHGLAGLSPPEAMHAMLELPTNRANYVGVLQDIGGYPDRLPIGLRTPGAAEIAELERGGGRWRAVVLLEDARALRNAAGLFSRVFVLDSYYDCGALLYAAWHDPTIKDEHSRRLAEQAARLVRAGPLLNAGSAVLTPDHLPGSWNPHPGWRQPRPTDDKRQLAAWSMRSGLVLLYWADRLGGVVCTSRSDVIAALDVVLGPDATSSALAFAEPRRIDAAQAARETFLDALGPRWAALQHLSRRRVRRRLDDVASDLTSLAACLPPTSITLPEPWRLILGSTSIPEPALLIRRVLSGQDPRRTPPLPRTLLKRRPLCLVPALP